MDLTFIKQVDFSKNIIKNLFTKHCLVILHRYKNER